MRRRRHTLEYPDGGREVVDAPGGSEGSDDDAGRGHEIVGESVVEVTLQLEDVLHVLELLLVSARKKEDRVSKYQYDVPSSHLHRFCVPSKSRDLAALMHEPSGAIEQVCAFSSLASLPNLSLPAIVSSKPLPPLPNNSKHRNGIPGSELLERLLVVGVVGINIAREPASRDGEGSALDGLLHEERPGGRAGEGSGARARCAADEGGDGHCVGGVWWWWWCEGRSGDGRRWVNYSA